MLNSLHSVKADKGLSPGTIKSYYWAVICVNAEIWKTVRSLGRGIKNSGPFVKILHYYIDEFENGAIRRYKYGINKPKGYN